MLSASSPTSAASRTKHAARLLYRCRRAFATIPTSSVRYYGLVAMMLCMFWLVYTRQPSATCHNNGIAPLASSHLLNTTTTTTNTVNNNNNNTRCVKSILFYTGYAYSAWGPPQYGKSALPGSETAVMLLAASLADLGHRVTVCGMVIHGHYGGVEYVDWAHRSERLTDSTWFDLIVVVRYVHFWLDWSPNSHLNYLWLHDNGVQPYHEGRALPHNAHPFIRHMWPTINRILALTNAHRTTFINGIDWMKDDIANNKGKMVAKIDVMPNALNVMNFAPYRDDESDGVAPVTRIANRFIYSSRPERGLLRLIRFFPAIRANLSDAELHVYTYGTHDGDGDRLAPARELITSLKMDGIIYLHNGLAQKELARAIETASVWFYPTHFLEAHSITALEMQLGGVLLVVPNIGSMLDTIGDRGLVLDIKPPARSDDTSITTSYWQHASPFISHEPLSVQAMHWSLSLPYPQFDGDMAATVMDTDLWQRYAIEQLLAVMHDPTGRMLDYTRRATTWARTQTWHNRAKQWMALPEWCSIPVVTTA